MVFSPIGCIASPYRSLRGMPVQPAGAADILSTVHVNAEYEAGLDGLDGFSHIYLIYQFHQSEGYALNVMPFLDNQVHGVFATRAPRRPNPIGLSIVELVSVFGNAITVKGADLLNGTPILDIKPYAGKFDRIENTRDGWLENTTQEVGQCRSDDRFLEARIPGITRISP